MLWVLKLKQFSSIKKHFWSFPFSPTFYKVENTNFLYIRMKIKLETYRFSHSPPIFTRLPGQLLCLRMNWIKIHLFPFELQQNYNLSEWEIPSISFCSNYLYSSMLRPSATSSELLRFVNMSNFHLLSYSTEAMWAKAGTVLNKKNAF